MSDHQKRIVNEALSKRPDGRLKYSTVIYSAPKKSGKSAIASAITLYFAYHSPYSQVYCLANDGVQATDRIYSPIRTNFKLHAQLGGIFKDVHYQLTEVTLPNNTKIRAIPCDAEGEAGSQPLFVCYSELWGFKTESKKRLFTEMTLPPTLYGYAMRWIESYAGETGTSELLEGLYRTAVKEGTPHPDFMDLRSNLSGNGDYVVFTNEAAGIFCYWDHEPRMKWQTPEYYQMEAKLLPPHEFDRIHRNMWISPVDSFIQPQLWESVKKENVPALDKSVPLVLGVDGAITNDFAAIVGVTRDYEDSSNLLVRFCYIFTPQKSGGTIKISEDVEPKLRELCAKYNVVCIAYDKYQLEDMAQRLRKENVVWMYNFSQQKDRAVADKGLYDRILNRSLFWDVNGDGLNKQGELPTLYQHITQAGAQTDGGKLRLVKLADSLKIDAAVACSMASEQCLRLNITGGKRLNLNMTEQELLQKLQDIRNARQ